MGLWYVCRDDGFVSIVGNLKFSRKGVNESLIWSGSSGKGEKKDRLDYGVPVTGSGHCEVRADQSRDFTVLPCLSEIAEECQ